MKWVFSACKPRRRWLQFSLRSLFVFTTVVCVWLGIHLYRVRQQAEIVRWIEAAGGGCWYDYEMDNSGYWLTDASAKPREPAWLFKLLGVDWFHDVAVVQLFRRGDGDAVTDNDLARLVRLRRLKKVMLRWSQDITGEGLRLLGKIDSIERLELSNSTIQGRDLVHLRGLKRLRSLELDAPIRDDGFRELSQMKSLEELELSHEGVTIDGYRSLQNLPRLKLLRISGKKLIDRSLASQIHLALPTVGIDDGWFQYLQHGGRPDD